LNLLLEGIVKTAMDDEIEMRWLYNSLGVIIVKHTKISSKLDD
jgi:hypothetical protein